MYRVPGTSSLTIKCFPSGHYYEDAWHLLKLHVGVYVHSFYHVVRTFSFIKFTCACNTTHCFEGFIVPTIESFCTGETSNYMLIVLYKNTNRKPDMIPNDSRSEGQDCQSKFGSEGVRCS
jgi:hypothetical protein